MKNLNARRLAPLLSAAFLAAAASALPFLAPAALHAQNAPAAAPTQKGAAPKPPVVDALEKAELLFRTGKYKETIKAYSDILVKFDKDLKEQEKNSKENSDITNALIHLRLAAAWQALPPVTEADKVNKWQQAEKEILLFLKYPNGVGNLYEDNNNRRVAAQTALAHIYGQQQRWDDAINLIVPLRNKEVRELPRASLSVAYCKALVGKAKAQNPTAYKKTIEESLANILNPIVSTRRFRVPEILEAGNYAVELLTELGKTKEARALSDSIADASNSNPLDRASASFQRMEIGAALFRQADEIGEDGDRAFKERLYRQALATFQETLRFAPLNALLDDAMKLQDEKFEKTKKDILSKVPAGQEANEGQKADIAAAEQEGNIFKENVKKFRESTDYDATISYRIGLCLLELKRPWEACIAFRDIFDNSPKFSKMSLVHYYYIKALRATGRIKEAQDECRKYIAKYPAAPEAEIGDVAVTIGEISFELKDYKEAIAQFKWARENVKSLTVAYKEWIDWYICVSYVEYMEWEKAIDAITAFLGGYPKSLQREQMLYMRAICCFFMAKSRTLTLQALGFEKDPEGKVSGYLTEYPDGRFKPEAEYRQMLINFGTDQKDEVARFKKRNGRLPAAWEISYNTGVEKAAKRWLDEYTVAKMKGKGKTEDYIAAVEKQTSDVLTLIGDVHFRYLEDKTPANTDAKKKENLRLAIDYYVKAALAIADEESMAFTFVTKELDSRLPAQNEWGRWLQINHNFYIRRPDGPKSDGFLYNILRAVDRLGKTPEDRRAKLAAEGIKGIPDEYLTKPAVEILGDAIKRGINNYRQEKIEMLTGELAVRIVNKTRREVDQENRAAQEAALAAAAAAASTPPATPAPAAAGTTAAPAAAAPPPPPPPLSREERARLNAERDKKVLNRASDQIAAFLKYDGEAKNIVPARIYYARAQVAQLLRNTTAYNENLARIIAAYKEEELSPTILGAGADYLLEKKNYARADSYAQYILDHWRSSTAAEIGLLTKAEILFAASETAAKTNAAEAHAKALEALVYVQEATDDGILFSKEKEARLLQARILIAIGGKTPDGKMLNYDVAAKILKEAAANKLWRGETTAWCLYYLGQIEEKKHNENEAINYYRRCFLSWKKHGIVTAKAYIRVIELFRKKGDRNGVGGTIYDMLQENNPASKQPEASLARKLQAQFPYTPPTQPVAVQPAVPTPAPAAK